MRGREADADLILKLFCILAKMLQMFLCSFFKKNIFVVFFRGMNSKLSIATVLVKKTNLM